MPAYLGGPVPGRRPDQTWFCRLLRRFSSVLVVVVVKGYFKYTIRRSRYETRIDRRQNGGGVSLRISGVNFQVQYFRERFCWICFRQT